MVTSWPVQRNLPSPAGCHSLHEDQSRIRWVGGAAALGVLSRISLALLQNECRRLQPVRDNTYPVESGRLRKRPRPMLDWLLERWLPPYLWVASRAIAGWRGRVRPRGPEKRLGVDSDSPPYPIRDGKHHFQSFLESTLMIARLLNFSSRPSGCDLYTANRCPDGTVIAMIKLAFHGFAV